MPRIFCTEKSPRIFFLCSTLQESQALKHCTLRKERKRRFPPPSKPGTSVRKVIAIFPFHSGGATEGIGIGMRASPILREQKTMHTSPPPPPPSLSARRSERRSGGRRRIAPLVTYSSAEREEERVNKVSYHQVLTCC